MGIADHRGACDDSDHRWRVVGLKRDDIAVVRYHSLPTNLLKGRQTDLEPRFEGPFHLLGREREEGIRPFEALQAEKLIAAIY